ncbi:MAG: zinc-binding dehydrogenase [Candidatus Binatia bacterium]
MRALRYHGPGLPLRVEEIGVPEPGPGEVLLEVHAAAILPNMSAILAEPAPFPVRRPPAPYTVGCGGVTGVVREIGPGTVGFAPGVRVFATEILACGSCRFCRSGCRNYCDGAAEMGLFAYGQAGEALLARYPDGALAEYARMPADQLARLPAGIDLERSARLGYWAIPFHGMKGRGVEPGAVVAVAGATGHMGIGAVAAALARGVAHVFAIARDPGRLAELTALAPGRVTALSVQDGPVAPRVRAATVGRGVDVLVDTQGFGDPATTMDAAGAVAKHGHIVLVGGVQGALPLRYDWFAWSGMTVSGSLNYLTSDVEELAELMADGLLAADHIRVKRYALEHVEQAMRDIPHLPSAFWAPVVRPRAGAV